MVHDCCLWHLGYFSILFFSLKDAKHLRMVVDIFFCVCSLYGWMLFSLQILEAFSNSPLRKEYLLKLMLRIVRGGKRSFKRDGCRK